MYMANAVQCDGSYAGVEKGNLLPSPDIPQSKNRKERTKEIAPSIRPASGKAVRCCFLVGGAGSISIELIAVSMFHIFTGPILPIRALPFALIVGDSRGFYTVH